MAYVIVPLLLGIIIPFLQVGSATVTSGISEGWMGLDVGPESVAQFSTTVEKSATIVWNGYVLTCVKNILSRAMYSVCIWGANHSTR